MKVKEEKLEKDDYLDLISEMFASRPAKKIGGSDGPDSAAPEKPKKGTELKVLDGKSAQNICKSFFANILPGILTLISIYLEYETSSLSHVFTRK